MLDLSNELIEMLSGATPVSTICFETATVEEYQSKAGNKLIDGGFLNIIIRYENSKISGLHISSMIKTTITVLGLPKMKHPNMSQVVGISKINENLIVQHWDGFESTINLTDLKIIKQCYTK